jgi:DNA-binding response OmpR family regulator
MATRPVVVVVEDNAELRSALKEALAAEGYEVLVARDEADALDLLRSNRVDLLISDVTTPPKALDFDALGREFPDMPVVALSSSAGARAAPSLLGVDARGRYRTLAKPFRLGELLAASRDVLNP